MALRRRNRASARVLGRTRAVHKPTRQAGRSTAGPLPCPEITMTRSSYVLDLYGRARAN